MAERVVDVRGLRCPLPALRATKALNRAPAGDAIVLVADDPLAGVDIPNLVRERGDVLVAVERDGTAFRFRIRRT